MYTRKTVILAFNKETKKDEVYGSLVGFQERHPNYSLATLEYYISRKKVPFEDKDFKLTRVKFIGRKKTKMICE